ncbi:MAG TPA: DUF1553 domain-containing protein, partial [Chthonomonadaceae bacterium]|nr:DUF1553 domain-containing protein [Chthonomonadaceae bacterium]
MRAIFEPHNVRTDRIPGQPDVSKDGLVRAFDADPTAVTYRFVRGDERNPDKSHAMAPGVPASLGGDFEVRPIAVPYHAANPDRRDFVVKETLDQSRRAVAAARSAAEAATAATAPRLRLAVEIAEARDAALRAVLAIESLDEAGRKGSAEWTERAHAAVSAQRAAAAKEAEAALLDARAEDAAAAEKVKAVADKPGTDKLRTIATAARAKVAAAEKALAAAQQALAGPPSTEYKPRPQETYPAESTGRRLAFAKWLTDTANPLAARIAVNHIWARHFGEGLVPSTSDFGRNGRPPSNPQLLDWLAAHFMAGQWRMKDLHRLMVTSRAYRLASTPDPADAKIDPDDVCLWRYPGRRMEAEAVRDNILYVAGHLDETRGGPEIDHTLGLTSRRRSIYLRTAAEKQSEFLQVFDGPSVTECYERRHTVMPQQALALSNSELTQRESRLLAAELSRTAGADDARFVQDAFLRVLARRPTVREAAECRKFLADQTTRLGRRTTMPADAAAKLRSDLVLVLFSHNDFVTIR